MKEQFYDELLNIKTVGDQKGFNKSFHYHRYEPTPYHALEKLFTKYELKSSDRLIDFGCGKGSWIFTSMYYVQWKHLSGISNRFYTIDRMIIFSF